MVGYAIFDLETEIKRLKEVGGNISLFELQLEEIKKAVFGG